MNAKKILTVLLGLMLISGCSLPQSTPALPLFTPTPLFILSPTLPLPTPVTPGVFPSATFAFPTFAPTTSVFITQAPTSAIATSQPAATQAPAATQPDSATFCADSQVTTLINSLKSALQTSDGKLLASLVSPAHGSEVRYYRDGRVVSYDKQHAQFLFESTFQVNWGPAAGSGLDTVGSWHEVVLPALLKVFNQSYTVTCNQLQVGGTTYNAAWAYPGVNFVSLYYPGTAQNGNMDWHTWAFGTEYVGGKPYLHSMMQFEWEP